MMQDLIEQMNVSVFHSRIKFDTINEKEHELKELTSRMEVSSVIARLRDFVSVDELNALNTAIVF